MADVLRRFDVVRAHIKVSRSIEFLNVLSHTDVVLKGFPREISTRRQPNVTFTSPTKYADYFQMGQVKLFLSTSFDVVPSRKPRILFILSKYNGPVLKLRLRQCHPSRPRLISVFVFSLKLNWLCFNFLDYATCSQRENKATGNGPQPCRAKLSQAESCRAKPSQAEPSRAKPISNLDRFAHLREFRWHKK